MAKKWSAKKWHIILAVALLVNAAAKAADTPGGKKEKKTKAIPLTMFIPGIQQMKNKQYAKGSLLLASFAGCIAGAVIHNNKGNDWYRQYQNSTNVDEIILLRQKTGNSFRKRNLFFVGIFSVWAIHVIDLKFFKSGKGGVKGEVGKNSIHFGFYYTF